MQKRSWMIGMALCLCFTLLLPICALGAKSFTDIKGHWANSYIVNLTSKGYLSGYPDGTFKPDRSISRAEFITALISSLGIAPAEPSSNSFKDTKNHWARKYIEEAVQRDILIPSEFSAGFGPDQNILRSQAAAMLVRAMGLYASAGQLDFTDNKDVAKSMYCNHIKAIYEAGIMSGFPDGSFGPFRSMTRAQACTVLIKMLEEQGTDPAPNQPAAGAITTVAVGEDLFTLGGSIKISFDNGTAYINVSSLSVANDALTVNNDYVFALNKTSGNPDIIVGNTRFAVDRMISSNNKLVVYPSNLRINELTVNSRLYDSKGIHMYMKGISKELYLSDLLINSETEVNINGRKYNLISDKVNIEVNNKFYNISRIQLQPGNTVPVLRETDPVVVKGLMMSDIAAIFVGTDSIDLDQVDAITFNAEGKRYRLSDTTLDIYGTFTFNDKTYSYSNVTMNIDNINYKISNIQYQKGQFIFSCQTSKANQLKFNGTLRAYDDIKIIKGNYEYDFDQITIVQRNVINLNGRKYTIPDSTIQCRVDKKIWDITRIEWSDSLEMPVVLAQEVEDTAQPVKYILYNEDNKKLAEGSSSKVSLKVGSKWISFNSIRMSDLNEFTYNGSTYTLIGSRVKISSVEYKIIDTAWHGSTQILDLYVREL